LLLLLLFIVCLYQCEMKIQSKKRCGVIDLPAMFTQCVQFRFGLLGINRVPSDWTRCQLYIKNSMECLGEICFECSEGTVRISKQEHFGFVSWIRKSKRKDQTCLPKEVEIGLRFWSIETWTVVCKTAATTTFNIGQFVREEKRIRRILLPLLPNKDLPSSFHITLEVFVESTPISEVMLMSDAIALRSRQDAARRLTMSDRSKTAPIEQLAQLKSTSTTLPSRSPSMDSVISTSHKGVEIWPSNSPKHDLISTEMESMVCFTEPLPESSKSADKEVSDCEDFLPSVSDRSSSTMICTDDFDEVEIEASEESWSQTNWTESSRTSVFDVIDHWERDSIKDVDLQHNFDALTTVPLQQKTESPKQKIQVQVMEVLGQILSFFVFVFVVCFVFHSINPPLVHLVDQNAFSVR
jgi:hypothetical protein